MGETARTMGDTMGERGERPRAAQRRVRFFFEPLYPDTELFPDDVLFPGGLLRVEEIVESVAASAGRLPDDERQRFERGTRSLLAFLIAEAAPREEWSRLDDAQLWTLIGFLAWLLVLLDRRH